jgi:hypothetical protein
VGPGAANRVLSGIRSAVERAIAHLKNWKILGTGYRRRLSELPGLVRTIVRLSGSERAGRRICA